MQEIKPEECVSFGTSLANDLRTGEFDSFAKKVDWKRFSQRIFTGLPISPDKRDTYIKQIRRRLLIEISSGESWVQHRDTEIVKNRCSIKIRVVASGSHVPVLNYLEFYGVKKEDVIKVFDFADLNSGRASESARWWVYLQEIGGGEELKVPLFESLKNLVEENAASGYKGLIRAYRKLPKEVQIQEKVMRLYVFALALTDENEYRKAFSVYNSKYPNDVRLSFGLVQDKVILLEPLYPPLTPASSPDGLPSSEMLYHYKNVLRYAGEDGAMEALVADSFRKKKDFKKSLLHANRAIQYEPNEAYGYAAKHSLYIFQSKFKEAVEIAKILEKRFEWEWDEMASDRRGDSWYNKFFDSEEFVAWRLSEGRCLEKARRNHKTSLTQKISEQRDLGDPKDPRFKKVKYISDLG